MKDKIYYPIDNKTQEVLNPVKAEYRGGMYHIPKDALESEPLPTKQGFAVVAVFDESGKAINSKYIEDHRGTTIYDESDCTRIQTIRELGPIDDAWTQEKPSTQFDEWINGVWVTNQSNKYIAEYNHVDDVRRGLYSQICDPLKSEAIDKADDGYNDEANALKRQAREAKKKIQAEHPWPTPPERSSEV
ncbi:hypothetical protein [Vibrio syngnathi]|uniref:Phage tail protein n=1 Tax=Vibrio syngnathi TaxID=3034029 RepID=A0AA34XQY3_9VIBR|nr:hypothetical protein [Vibrio syngnathi]ARP40639.1 hypothetical protein K08M4_39780 [Vibrio syngnathi]